MACEEEAEEVVERQVEARREKERIVSCTRHGGQHFPECSHTTCFPSAILVRQADGHLAVPLSDATSVLTAAGICTEEPVEPNLNLTRPVSSMSGKGSRARRWDDEDEEDGSDEEGIDLMNEDGDARGSKKGGGSDDEADSSEEDDDDDEEAAAEVAKGFIVDDDNDEEGEDDSEDEKARKKRERKEKRRQKRKQLEEEEELDEEDLDLVAENTGRTRKKDSVSWRLRMRKYA